MAHRNTGDFPMSGPHPVLEAQCKGTLGDDTHPMETQ